MATVKQTIQREDGSEVQIVAQDFFGIGLTRSVGVYVLRRESPSHAWKLTDDRPHPDWRKMSVSDYVRHGRSEMLRTVSHGELLKVTHALQLAFESTEAAALRAM